MARRGGGRPAGGRKLRGSRSARSPSPRSGRRSPHPREIDRRPGGRPAGAPDRRPPRRLHAEPAALAEGPRRASRPAASSRSPSGSWSSASARSRAFVAREYWTIEDAARARTGRPFDGGPRADRRAPSRRSATRRRPRRHVEALRGLRSRSSARSRSRTSRSAARRRRSRPRTLQQEASRKLGFSPKRTMRVAQRLYEGVETPEGQVGLITYMRTDSVALVGPGAWPRRGRSSRARFGSAYVDAEGPRATGPSPGAPRRRTRRSGRRRFARDPEALAATLGRDEARLYRLIWQRALAQPDGARSSSRRPRSTSRPAGYGLRASATRTLFDGFSRRLHGGPRRRAEEEAERTLPPLRPATRRGSPRSCRRSTSPSRRPRYTEATPHQGARGARDRPPVDVRRHDLHDRRPRLRRDPRATPPPGAGRRDRHGPARGALRRVRGPRVHGPDGGGARRGRPRRARLGAAAARVLRSAPGRSSTRSAGSCAGRTSRRRRPTRSARSGHPMVIRLGRNGRFLACSLYPSTRSRGRSRARSRTCRRCPGSASRARPAARRTGACSWPSAAGSGRSSAATATRTAATSRRTARRRRSSCRSTVACPTCAEGHLVARRARRTGSVFWGCSRYPKCDFTTLARAARVRSTSPTAARSRGATTPTRPSA